MNMTKRPAGIRRLLTFLLFITLMLALTEVAQAVLMNHKLSGDMISGGDVHFYQISADGRRVVFVADARLNNVDELFSVLTTGGQRVQLSTPLMADQNVSQFVVSPDSQYVAYLVSETSKSHGLYLVPISGGSPVELFGDLPDGNIILDIRITPDSQNVIFLQVRMATMHVPETETLWRVPIAGGDPIMISPGSCDPCSFEYQIAPDSQSIIYLQRPYATFNSLWGSDLAGNREMLDSSGIRDFQITPDGDYVIYRQQDAGSAIHLFSIPISGGIPSKLSGDPAHSMQVKSFEISPNSQQVVYLADESLDEMFMLYGAKADGSSPSSWPLIAGLVPTDRDVEGFRITPNSLGVVFKADLIIDEKVDLFSVPITGASPFHLSPGMHNDGDVSGFMITPNSQGVVFVANAIDPGKEELFAATINGSYLNRLNANLPAGGNVIDFRISPNSQGVVYLADQGVASQFNIYAVPTVGGLTPTRVNSVMVAGGDVHRFTITPDSKGVVYLADQLADGVDELFVTYDYQVVYLPLLQR
jgi:dipeptidyl aminopeptidase/acylaminoacyl peptidase